MSETEVEVPLEEPEQGDEATESPETPDEDAEVDEEPEAVAEPQKPVQEPVGPSEADLEKASKAMDRAAKAYIDKAVTNLGGDLGGFQACPMCRDYWPGLRLNRVPEGETLAAIQVAIGQDPDPPLRPDVFSRQCQVCDGYGRLESWSKDRARKSLTCLECNGLGYIPTDDRRKGGRVTALPAGNGSPEPPQSTYSGVEPPEAEALRQLGAIVVWPIEAGTMG